MLAVFKGSTNGRPNLYKNYENWKISKAENFFFAEFSRYREEIFTPELFLKIPIFGVLNEKNG